MISFESRDDEGSEHPVKTADLHPLPTDTSLDQQDSNSMIPPIANENDAIRDLLCLVDA